MTTATPELGYCNRCGQPRVVLPLRLPGWYHTYRICGVCLGELQAIVDAACPATDETPKGGEDKG